ncbi:MAG: phage head-tail joining protein [Hyphomonas sp.]
MTLTVSELTSLRDGLVKARSNGLREVRDQNGETLTYKSDSEMAAAIASLDRQIQSAQTKPTANTIVFATSKGL